MKISLAWIFDHINANWKDVDVPKLVDLFNMTTAEIEGFDRVKVDLEKFTIARVKSVGDKSLVFSPELDKDLELPVRNDACVGSYCLLIQEDKGWRWAGGKDFKSEKDDLLSVLCFTDDVAAKNWKNGIEIEDVIFEVDNKSLTNRPDMWGHRGFAREVAALLDLDLLPYDNFLEKLPMVEYAKTSQPTKTDPFTVSVETKTCNRFATYYLQEAKNLPSQLWMALRLVRIDSRPIDTFVDLTNYAMFDTGQPMHAFDATKFAKQKLIVRQAKKDEVLTLLDDSELKLCASDMVIADESKPVSLAAIKGGKDSGIANTTTSLLLESANFDATTVRQSSTKHKVRTDASARFEKTLDPNQNIYAIERFLKLLKEIDPSLKLTSEISSIGAVVPDGEIVISHKVIEQKMGVELESGFVEKVLSKIGFTVKDKDGVYQITVPTYRSTKDVTIAEDIVEEVARFYGYGNIPQTLPSKLMQPGDLSNVMIVRQIKQQFVDAAAMHEVQNYPFYDESFLKEINWQPKGAVTIKNPVSENWYRLVTSLIPHLCKNVQTNYLVQNDLRFFEWARSWQQIDANNANEQRSLAGLFFKQKGEVDFYSCKEELASLFKIFGINVEWQKASEDLPDWFHPYKTAKLVCDGKEIGFAGELSKVWLSKIADGNAFAFEINGDFLLGYEQEEIRYEAASKYQSVANDISLFVSKNITVAQLKKEIKLASDKIYKIDLIDLFEKDEWQDKKSLTFRYHFVDVDKTLSGDDILTIQKNVEAAILKCGAQVR